MLKAKGAKHAHTYANNENTIICASAQLKISDSDIRVKIKYFEI